MTGLVSVVASLVVAMVIKDSAMETISDQFMAERACTFYEIKLVHYKFQLI